MTAASPFAGLPPGEHIDLARPRGREALARAALLVRHLTVRAVAERHRGSVLGFAWTLFNPLLMMLVYTFVFRHVLRMGLEGLPYTAFFLTNYLAWTLFSRAALEAGTSTLAGAHLLRRAVFEPAALPVSAAAAHLVHFVFALPVLVIFNAVMGLWPGPAVLLVVPAALLLTLQALALGLTLAALAPRWRDVLPLAEVALTAWFFVSPVVYPLTLAAAQLSPAAFSLYQANPLVAPLALMQAAFLGQPVPPSAVATGTALTLAALAAAAWLFRRRLRGVAELL